MACSCELDKAETGRSCAVAPHQNYTAFHWDVHWEGPSVADGGPNASHASQTTNAMDPCDIIHRCAVLHLREVMHRRFCATLTHPQLGTCVGGGGQNHQPVTEQRRRAAQCGVRHAWLSARCRRGSGRRDERRQIEEVAQTPQHQRGSSVDAAHHRRTTQRSQECGGWVRGAIRARRQNVGASTAACALCKSVEMRSISATS